MSRVLLVGIGGPTCSGKTTLTKHLLSLLPSSSRKPFIIHQDDFAPPESQLVWNEDVGSADWDDPDTSVDWTKLRRSLAYVKEHGQLPPDHSSHDDLNPLPDLPVSSDVQEQCSRQLREAVHGQDVQVVFLDGFLLYHDQQVRSIIDVPIFLRIGRALLQDRRERRGGYVTAEGETWKVSDAYLIHRLGNMS